MTLAVRHNVQMRCWGKTGTNTDPANPNVTRDIPWDEEHSGKEWDLTSNLSQNFTSPEAGLHLCSHRNNAPKLPKMTNPGIRA